MQQEELFANKFEKNTAFEETNEKTIKAQAGMWEVDDRVHANPNLRFQREQNSFAEMIYEQGTGTILSGAAIPKGMIEFVEKRFINVFNYKHSRFISIEKAAARCFEYLDLQEPYFFLVDMPVSLTGENYNYTYQMKKTGSVLSPSDIETFGVQKGWAFPHYARAHQIVTSAATAAVMRGQFVPKPKVGGENKMGSLATGEQNQLGMTDHDVLEYICSAIFGDISFVKNMVAEWCEDFYECLVYDVKTHDAETAQEIRDASSGDFKFWLSVALGVFTWLKGPHGLKFLIEYHPIYYQLLDWNYDTNNPKMRDDTESWAIVNSWSIYTSTDVIRVPGVPPGTCCVSKQHLHCTELVNSHAVKSKICYCGEELDYKADSYYTANHNKQRLNTPACRRWWDDHPEPQMVFVSYAAMYNMLKNIDPNTRCQRHTCPNTQCSYHAGNYSRIRALTEQRTKLLTSNKPH